MDRGQQLAWIANIERNRDRNEGNAVAEFAHVVAAAQVDGNHHAEQPALHAIPVQLQVAPYRRRNQSQDDVVYGYAKGLPYRFYMQQRDVCPRKFLWSAVRNVKAQTLGEGSDLWQQS